VGAATYTAPAASPSGSTVTVTATSVADPSLSKSATITIVAPIPISVSFFAAPPASLVVGSQATLNAQIDNDVSANPQVKWSVSCGGTACGTLSPTTTTSEALTTYTAPNAIPPGNTVTVTVTSITDPTKSASASIVITAAGAALADGTYVFQISGSPFVTGVVVAKGGAITGGEQDAISDDSDNGPTSVFDKITGGSYANTPDGNVQISIQTAASGVETLSGALASGGHGFVSGVDGVIGNGTLELQSAVAAPAGGYAISLDAGNLYDGSPWIAGVLNVDGTGTISGAGSILNGTDTGTGAIAASTVSAHDSFGRVLIQLNLGASSQLSSLPIAGYIVDSTHIRLILAGNPDNSDVVVGVSGGLALGQGANTGKFTADSVVGTSYVFGAAGIDQQGTLQLAGVFHLNAGGAVSGFLNWNDLSGGAAQAPLAFTGTYTVDPTGRITLSDLTGGANFSYSFYAYLDGNGGGLILSDDANDTFGGRAYQQQAATLSASSFGGAYGLNASLAGVTQADVPATGVAVGTFTSTASGDTDKVAGYADLGNGGQDFAIHGSFTAGAGGAFSGTLAGFDGLILGFNTGSPGTYNNFTLYMVDSTQGVLIETDNAQMLLGRVGLAQ